MAQPVGKPLAPRRKELPCDFAVAKAARNRALTTAVVACGIGALLLWASIAGMKADALSRLFVALLGLLAAAGGWLVAATAFVSVTMDDAGLVVRGNGRNRRVAWDEIGNITFGATL